MIIEETVAIFFLAHSLPNNVMANKKKEKETEEEEEKKIFAECVFAEKLLFVVLMTIYFFIYIYITIL